VIHYAAFSSVELLLAERHFGGLDGSVGKFEGHTGKPAVMELTIMMRLIAALLVATVMNCKASSTDLEAISLIESGGNDRAIGGAGEVSRYQILPRVWKTYSHSRDYQNRFLAGEIAKRHLEALQRSFEQASGRKPGDFDLYVLWNAGMDYYRRHGFSPRRVHTVIRERADRFVNLKQILTPNLRDQQARLANY
jgi:hypothetical protein